MLVIYMGNTYVFVDDIIIVRHSINDESFR